MRYGLMKSAIDLVKAGHKYLRRWKGPDGKWRYAYHRDAAGRPIVNPNIQTVGRGTLKGVTEKDVKRLLSQFRRRPKGQGREKTVQTRADLDILLTRSTFALMSAGRNPNNPEDMKLTDAQVRERHNRLIADLKEEGYIFTQCRGKYENPEESVMIMTHDADRDNVLELGAKYNQDSVVFSSKGQNEMIYTTGPNKGQNDMQGSGYEEVPDADNYYTKLPLATGETVKFTMLLESIKKAIMNYLRNMHVMKPTELIKAKKMPIGSVVTRGGESYRKMGEGNWVRIPKKEATAIRSTSAKVLDKVKRALKTVNAYDYTKDMTRGGDAFEQAQYAALKKEFKDFPVSYKRFIQISNRSDIQTGMDLWEALSSEVQKKGTR